MAAKCPPFFITLQRFILVNTFSATTRGGRMISKGNSAYPTGKRLFFHQESAMECATYRNMAKRKIQYIR